jgi:hypothetical protein
LASLCSFGYCEIGLFRSHDCIEKQALTTEAEMNRSKKSNLQLQRGQTGKSRVDCILNRKEQSSAMQLVLVELIALWSVNWVKVVNYLRPASLGATAQSASHASLGRLINHTIGQQIMPN